MSSRNTILLTQARSAILKTLAYSDLFDFPLSQEELWRYLKYDKPVDKKYFLAALQQMTGQTLGYQAGVYFLLDHDFQVALRKKRSLISDKKLQRARLAARLLRIIPTIQFIGISGSLAMHNADQDDDIDLFIITQPGLLWTTRFLTVTLLSLVHMVRKKRTKKTTNLVCLNMFMDESSLMLDSKRQDVYTAHELWQLKPLFNRQETYTRLLQANTWIGNFLPNASLLTQHTSPHPAVRLHRPTFLGKIGETLLKTIQMNIINHTRTTETITDTFLAFHPQDSREKTLEKFATHEHVLSLNHPSTKPL